MFNWFRRQHSSSNQPQEQEQEQEQEQQPIVVEDQDTTVESSEEVTEKNQLNWAKAAFKNIQQRKAQETTEVNPTEAETSETAEETVTASGPAWMQKSARLEQLKETAITSPADEPETTTQTDDIDEEFVWSANVLAKQGRKAEDVSEEEINWLKRLRRGLGKTRRGLVNQLKSIVGQGPLNQDAVSDIESLLLQADVGVEATDQIIDALQTKLRQESLPSNQALEYLKEILQEILDSPLKDVEDIGFEPEKGKLNIWLLTGVNGVGKTTTIGKLANLAQKSGYSCMIAAADTFRAAAVEQVKVWGDRSGTEVIANPGKNTDPAAVVFDGIAAAQARNTELLLVDTAGRLQNKKNLMDELTKIRRIVDKKASNAHVESLLVLDATLGQNGLRQAQVFAEAAQLSGVVLTKLDGTAKGGVALAVVQELNLPIRFIGAGEGIEDLRPFSSYEFVEALLNG
ncbi:signal recognition particle-docking protein FtsY [Chroococcus sp. FPU101]|uniref:signal recognition particle-docking protein FtsY n=1 Tax=Chroococcus sp. FPU101 TaxID=1974212 RepID=UPI001A8F881A|nr:signal recognition particle-docking protein FtsY [Chroococcus sp. FPU101]GFE68705.1 signal recognition particle-docking protein FtsY [Chroococcus sp. FPU101]